MNGLLNRYDFVLLFDVTNGNPNGDPDAGNMPRLDPETNHGLVSDVCLKRRIRNYVDLTKSGEGGYAIYVQENAILNEQHRGAYKAVRPNNDKVLKEHKLSPQSAEEADRLRWYMCDNFFDVRTFGAVMSTGINCGQVRGPVQLAFARSVEPIMPVEVTITRMAATNEQKKTSVGPGDEEDDRRDNRTMGRKFIIPYGLYRAHGFISAKLSERTGFGENDLGLLFDALRTMFEHDRSSSRGEMTTRKLIVFKHKSALGNAPAHALFDRIKVCRTLDGVAVPCGDERLSSQLPARRYSDYQLEFDLRDLPYGIEFIDCL